MNEFIFFDLDGTLTNPAEGITNSFIHALNFFGIEIPDYKKLCSFIGPPLVTTFKTQFGFDDEKANEGVLKYREYFGEKGLFENQVFKEIPDLLKNLNEKGFILAVATSKPEEYSRRILQKFDLAKYFKRICGSNMDETRSKKSEVIEYAISELKIQDRNSVLMIGDREHDVLGAKECKIKSCGVLWGFGSKNELKKAGADYIAKDFKDLQKIIEEWASFNK